jgi:GNAT superfamily N-acetyltransferase
VFSIETTSDTTRRELIEQRLRHANDQRSSVMRTLRGTPADEKRPVDAYAYALDGNGDGELVGGLVGHSWGHWLHIELLWVRDDQRGAGLGTQLIGEAEESARREHDCGHARVATWDFQARGFYEKCGYTVVGVVPDYPPGCIDYILTKQLWPY